LRLIRLPAAVACVIATAACAELDPALDALIDSGKDAELQRLCDERLTRDPADHVALCYRARVPLERGTADRFDEAIARLERCVELRPTASDYHLWLGRAYGLKAQHAGVFCALGLVRGVRAEFLKALALDPRNHDARHDLLRFYLGAPRIAGGGVSKARALAEDCEPVDADMAHVLRAIILLNDRQFESAWSAAKTIGTPQDSRVAGYARALFRDLGAAARREGHTDLAARIEAERARRETGPPESQ
jgi:tetratricopeptide (TPR) repeat protein